MSSLDVSLPAGLTGGSPLDQFPWLKDRLPKLRPLLDRYCSPEVFDELMQQLGQGGHVQSLPEGIMVTRWAQANLLYLGVADLMAEQMKRRQAAGGLLDWKEIADLKNLSDATLKLHKQCIETEAEAVLSRRAQMELGATQGDPVAKALEAWANRELPQGERMSSFLGGSSSPSQVAAIDAQFEMVEAEPDMNELTPEQWQRLRG